MTRSELPLLGGKSRFESVGELLCERAGDCERLLPLPDDDDRPPYCCMNGGEGGKRGMSIGIPYIGMGTDVMPMPTGIAIGIPMPSMGIGAFIGMGMFMDHMLGMGGTGTSLRRRELPDSDTIDARRLELL